MKHLEAIHHQAGNYIINIKGNRADVFCCGIAFHYLPNKSNKNTCMFAGSYDIGLVREGKYRQIDMFRFNPKFIDGNPDLENTK